MSGVISSPSMSSKNELAELRTMIEKLQIEKKAMKENNNNKEEISKEQTSKAIEMNDGIKKLLEKESKPKPKYGYRGGFRGGRGGYNNNNNRGGYNNNRGGYNNRYNSGYSKKFTPTFNKSYGSPTAYTPSYNKYQKYPQASANANGKMKGGMKEMKEYAGPEGSGQDAIRFFKIKYYVSVAATSNILFSVFTTSPSTSDDWNSIVALFDSYRVCAMKIKFVPTCPNDPSSTKYAPIYVYADVDENVTVAPSVPAMLEYENLKVKDATKPWQYYTKFPKVTATGTANINLDGYLDTATPQATGSIVMYSTPLSNIVYGYVIITWYVAVKNRN